MFYKIRKLFFTYLMIAGGYALFVIFSHFFN